METREIPIVRIPEEAIGDFRNFKNVQVCVERGIVLQTSDLVRYSGLYVEGIARVARFVRVEGGEAFYMIGKLN